MPLKRLPMLVLLLGMLAALAPFVGQHIVNSDELDELANAWRQVHGQVIYRDFFEFVPPLPHWLAAGLLAWQGPGVWWPRLLQAALLVLAGAAQYGAARAQGVRSWLAVLPGLVTATALFPQFPLYYHHWLALAFASGALWLVTLDTLGAAAGAGFLVGLAGLCTQSDGVMLALAFALALRSKPRQVLAGVAGCLLPLGLACLALSLKGALSPAVEQVVSWSLTHYRARGGINDVSFGSDLKAFLPAVQGPFALPRAYHLLWMYGLWPVLAVVAVWRRPVPGPVEWVGLAAIAACLLGRADFAHIAMYMSLTLVVAVVWLERLSPRAGWALAAFGLAGALLSVQRAIVLPGMFGGAPDAYMASLPINQYVRQTCPPAERIAVLPSGGLNYLYGRPPATPYTLMFPPAMGYNAKEEYIAWWRGVAKARPKLILIISSLDRDHTLAMYQPPALRGYKPGPEMTTPLNDQVYNVFTIERED